MTSFNELSLQPTTLAALAQMNFTTATPIQAQSIPLLMQGRDVLAQARTGTGKTAAFGIPIIEGASGDGDPGVLALVLVPTRELALQVTEELKRLSQGTQVKIAPVYGGVGMGAQMENLRRRVPMVVVATPGRLLDHMNQRNVDLSTVRMLVLDEADRMLDMGFLPDVERIIKALPAERQTALFSATVPEQIRRIVHRFMKNPETVKTQEGPETTPVSAQFRIHIAGNQKGQALQALLAKEAPERAIVFTRTKHRARSVARVLDRNGWPAVALQGNMTQGQRERALDAFRAGQAKILVATDVASRGLDIPEISHVVNYDLPDEPEAYVHRIGRTARMGRPGRAFTFIQPDQVRDADGIARAARVTMDPYEVDVSQVELVQPQAPQHNGNGSHAQPHGGQSRSDNGEKRHFRPRPQNGNGGGQRPWRPRGDQRQGGGQQGGQRQWQPRGDRRDGGRDTRAPRSEMPSNDKPNASPQWEGSYGGDRASNEYRTGGRPAPRYGGPRRSYGGNGGGNGGGGGYGGGQKRNGRGRGRPRY